MLFKLSYCCCWFAAEMVTPAQWKAQITMNSNMRVLCLDQHLEKGAGCC